jgi:signal transduction histidine kinase/ActR/RegA family two-component response regulator
MMSESIRRLEEEIQRLNQEFAILNVISQTVNESVDLHEILNNTLDRITGLTEVKLASFHLLDNQSGDLIVVAYRGFEKAFMKKAGPVKMGEGATGKAALSGEPLFIEDYRHHPDALRHALEEGLESLAVIPLKLRDRIYGTLNIAWKECHAFNPFEKNLFRSIGQIISSAMERTYLYAENAQRLEEQKTLYAISQEIASRLELKVILQRIMESAVALLRVETGEITLWDYRKRNYVVAIVHGLPPSLVGTEVLPPMSGIVGEICSKKVPVVYDDYEHHPDRRKDLDPYHFKEVLGVPLIVRQMIIGTMVVATSDEKKHFQQNEMELLFNFAHHAGIAIGNAQLYEDSLAKINQLTTLHEIGTTLSSTLDLDELLKKTLEILRDRWGYALCTILFLDQEKDKLFIKYVLGMDYDKVKDLRFKVGVEGLVGWAAKSGEALYVPDVSKDPRYIQGSPEGKSEAVFPLKIREEVIGILDIQSNVLDGFGEEELKVLSSFARQVSISIENARLFSDLKQTLDDLQQAQDQMVQTEKLKALGEMASGVAHDFNNVLAVILGNIQLLLHQLPHLPVEEIQERLRIIERSSKDGAETVRRIQEFTGVRKDREFLPVDLNEIAREVITVTQPRWRDQAQSKGVQIELSPHYERIPSVLGNSSELREVLTNLVFNAVDAMPRGGCLSFTTGHQGDWVEVRVSDTGTGMTEDVKRRVFDPFFTTKGVTSSGLGMSVSYGIIRRHGGEILIESRPGEGTTFIIRLPRGKKEASVPHKEIPTVPDAERARILVIDDEDSVRDVLSQMLRAKGHQVVGAASGEEGIEKFEKGTFDLVLTDLGMPKISGWEVGKAIKKMNSKVPVAMITGWGMELNRDKMSESGIDLIISKPFDFSRVLQLVSEALDLKEKTS